MICSYKLVILVGDDPDNYGMLYWSRQGEIQGLLRAHFTGVVCTKSYFTDKKEYIAEWRCVGTPEMITWLGLQVRIIKVKKQGFVRAK